MMKISFARVVGFSLSFFLIQAAQALPVNMHLVDSNPGTGFEIYRSSVPSTDDVKQWCAMGITEVYVLSGDAEAHELSDPSACPGLKIIYNERQNARVPLTTEFLAQFDNWVKDAQTNGKKILFRCSCGCHRTGRLAAYYRMKYNGWSVNDAWSELRRLAKWMILFPHLDNQVWALGNYVANQPCDEKYKYCVWNLATGEVAEPTQSTPPPSESFAARFD